MKVVHQEILDRPRASILKPCGDVLFNQFGMHTVVERFIELRRVTFADATPPSDGPALQMRATIQYAAPTATSTAMASNLNDQDLVGHENNGMATTAIPATTDIPASPLLPRRYDRLTRPPERYSRIVLHGLQ